jgi:hypothetical protein
MRKIKSQEENSLNQKIGLRFKETRGYWKLKEETLDRTVWRNGFGRGCGPVVRQSKMAVQNTCICQRLS